MRVTWPDCYRIELERVDWSSLWQEPSVAPDVECEPVGRMIAICIDTSMPGHFDRDRAREREDARRSLTHRSLHRLAGEETTLAVVVSCDRCRRETGVNSAGATRHVADAWPGCNEPSCACAR